MPKNVGDLGKLIGAKGFKKLPKVQQIAQSGHTVKVTAVNLCCVTMLLKTLFITTARGVLKPDKPFRLAIAIKACQISLYVGTICCNLLQSA